MQHGDLASEQPQYQDATADDEGEFDEISSDGTYIDINDILVAQESQSPVDDGCACSDAEADYTYKSPCHSGAAAEGETEEKLAHEDYEELTAVSCHTGATAEGEAEEKLAHEDYEELTAVSAKRHAADTESLADKESQKSDLEDAEWKQGTHVEAVAGSKMSDPWRPQDFADEDAPTPLESLLLEAIAFPDDSDFAEASMCAMVLESQSADVPAVSASSRSRVYREWKVMIGCS